MSAEVPQDPHLRDVVIRSQRRSRSVPTQANIVLVGPNGIGKTMLAEHLAHHAVMHGFTARFTTASALLGDLNAPDGAAALRRRLHRSLKPALLVIDELGYSPYNNRYADLLFEVVTRRSDRSDRIASRLAKR